VWEWSGEQVARRVGADKSVSLREREWGGVSWRKGRARRGGGCERNLLVESANTNAANGTRFARQKCMYLFGR